MIRPNDNEPETHPLFPSGEWEGFYVYAWSKEQHKMSCHLDFKNGVITGSGGDDINAFTWHGRYDVETFVCQLVKQYANYEVYYDGRADENGIWGIWRIMFSNGGFHIWPKDDLRSERAEAVVSKALERELLLE